MLSIPVKEGDNIERALKRFKKKFDRTKRMRELRVRKEFVKPSVIKREAQKKAVYKNTMQLGNE
jgi:small subunit ribosomal protein S21